MGQYSDSRANAMLGTLPSPIFVGLSTTTPTAAGANVTEPVGNGYARQSATLGAAAGRNRTNTNALNLTASGGDWGTCTHTVYYSAVTGGTFEGFDDLTAPRNMVDGAQMDFAIGALDFDLP